MFAFQEVYLYNVSFIIIIEELLVNSFFLKKFRGIYMAEKSMIIALVISFFLTGLGIAYAGDVKKGLIFFVIGIILSVLSMYVSMLFGIIAFIFWIYAMYATYQEVNAVNGA